MSTDETQSNVNDQAPPSGKEDASRPAQVRIKLALEPGTDLEVELIAESDTGKPLGTRLVKFKNPELKDWYSASKTSCSS